MNFEQYNDIITVKKAHSEEYELMYIDFTNEIYSNAGFDINDSNEIPINEIPIASVMSPTVITKASKLSNTDTSNIRKNIIDKIIYLSNIHRDEDINTYNGISNVYDVEEKLIKASNYIASKNRMGPANHIIANQFTFDKYKNIFDKLNLTAIIDETVNDVILYRMNSIDQPGLVLIYFDDIYDIADIGFFPYRNYLKLSL
jgi:hypothetical protein